MAKLRRLGLTEIYEAAGFTIGAPGCSYCLGVAADRAGEGEVWLSSQNRNFRNRMGKGSIANLASAATVRVSGIHFKASCLTRALLTCSSVYTRRVPLQRRQAYAGLICPTMLSQVAASSFNMEVTNPRHFLDSIDRDRCVSRLLIAWPLCNTKHAVRGPTNASVSLFALLLAARMGSVIIPACPPLRFEAMLAEWKSPAPAYQVSEPQPELHSLSAIDQGGQAQNQGVEPGSGSGSEQELRYARKFTGKAQVFEANIDTDAIIPAEFMPGMSRFGAPLYGKIPEQNLGALLKKKALL